jgi:hypothetical protein
MLYFGKARCMRLRLDPNAAAVAGQLEAATGGDKSVSVGGGDKSVGSGTEYSNGGEGTPDFSQTLQDPLMPPGLMFRYRKPRHQLVMIGYEIVLPILVVGLGGFFSISTLILLFQPSE